MRYVKGNLFNAPEKIIAHGCNMQGVMGAGIAKIIKEKYPLAFAAYQLAHKTTGLRLGDAIIWQDFPNNFIVANLITQDNYGRGSRLVNYEACALAFDKLADTFDNYDTGKTSIAIPKIGAGLGGGSWEVIEAIIKEVERNRPNIEFVVYEI